MFAGEVRPPGNDGGDDGNAPAGEALPGRGGRGDAAEVEPRELARRVCLGILQRTPKTRAQLAEALRRRGIPDDVAEEVLERFTEVGLIDDAAFAAAWVESRHAGRGLARRALAHELRARGVDDDIVEEVVDTLGPEQEVATARALVARRLPGTARLDPAVRARRLVGILVRRGYSVALAGWVVREALERAGADTAALEDDLS